MSLRTKRKHYVNNMDSLQTLLFFCIVEDLVARKALLNYYALMKKYQMIEKH